MSHVKTLPTLTRTVAGIGFVMFAMLPALAEDAPPPPIGSYEAYKTAVDRICYAEKEGPKWEGIPPWNRKIGPKNEIPPELLTIQRNDYPNIYDPDSNKKFQEGIKSVKGQEDELQGIIALESQNLPVASQIEKAGLMYRERMNGVYACATLNAKYKVNTRLIKQFDQSGSNIKRDLDKANTQIVAQMKQHSCRDTSKEQEGGELSTKLSLIRQSTIEYCNYRHYLSYVDYNVKNQLSDVIKAEEKLRTATNQNASLADRLPNSEAVASQLGNVTARTTWEIEHTQQVYDDAFDAYREFEQNYGAHVLLVLIEDRYITIREYLRDTMNPIGQVIYKASNASSPGK